MSSIVLMNTSYDQDMDKLSWLSSSGCVLQGQTQVQSSFRIVEGRKAK